MKNNPLPLRSNLEPLEDRIALSGIGTGQHLRFATFNDASGDLVTVKLVGGPVTAAFNIALDGGDTTNADIDSIFITNGTLVSGNITLKASLSITVIPVKLAAGTPGIVPDLYSNGTCHVGSISADANTTALRGINASGAILDDIGLQNTDIGFIGMSPGRAPIVDRIMGAAVGGIASNYIPQAQFVDFGAIDAHSIGSLTLRGASASGTVSGNDFLGSINVTTGIGRITGLHAQLSGAVTADNIGRISALNLNGNITTTGASPSALTLRVGGAGVSSGVLIDAAGDVNLEVGAGGFAGTINAAGTISGAASVSTDAIHISGGLTGTLHSSAGNIADLIVTGASGIAGSVIADNGNIGTVTADNIVGGFINAQVGNIAGIVAHTSTAAAAIGANSSIHAGGTLGKIDVVDSASAGIGILNAHIRADGNIAAINVTVNGGNTAIGIKGSNITTAANITGPINVTAGNAGFATNTGIDRTTIAAAGNIGNITVAGQVNGSQILAGVDLGTDFALGGTIESTDLFFDGKSIGNVTITGQFIGSDLAASVDPGRDLAFGTGGGSSADKNVGAIGGTIGTVSLQTGSAASGLIRAYADSGETNGIEAKTIGAVTIGSPTRGVAVLLPGSEVDWANDGFDPNTDIAIRQI